MANAVYPTALASFLKADIDLENDTIKVALLTSSYTYSASHDFFDDCEAYDVGTAQTLGGKTFTSGVFDANNSTWTGLTGSEVAKLVIYKDTGTPGTSNLICYMDTFASGMPYTPNGADFTMTWNGSGIFSI